VAPPSSSNSTVTRGPLKLVSDDHGDTLLWDGLRFSLTADQRPPFDLDGEVREEDTALLLSAECQISPSALPLATQAAVARPLKPGTAALRHGSPMQLLAVIHDLDREPTWREAWICGALRHALRLAEEHRLANLAIPLLGTAHGRIDIRRALYLTLRTLSKRRSRSLRCIWLRVAEQYIAMAKSELSERISR